MDERTYLGVTFLTEVVILVIVFVGAYFIFKPVLKRDREKREQLRKEDEERRKQAKDSDS